MTDARRAEWLAWRRDRIGGSDVAGILGLSPWESPYSIWLSKVMDLPDREPSEAMEFGMRAEPMLARWFTDRTGLFVFGEQMWCTHPTIRYAGCTVDGLVGDSPNSLDLDVALGAAEWKTTSDPPAEWEGKVPDHYACQATWTMAVLDVEQVWFGVLHLAYGRPAFRVYEFKRDHDDEAFVLAACERFWTEHVVTGLPPDIDAHPATLAALNARWPETTEAALLVDERTGFLLEQHHWFRAEADSALTELDIVDNQLRALIGDNEAIVSEPDAKGRTKNLATWKWQTRHGVDLDRLRAAWPDVVRQFETETRSRVLRVTKPKRGEP